MYSTYSNRTGKSFSLESSVTDISSEREPFNPLVWSNVFEALSHFGIKIEPSKQEILVKASNTQFVLDIIEALAEIDNSNSGQLGQAMKRRLGIKFNQPQKAAAQSPRQNAARPDLDFDDERSQNSGFGTPSTKYQRVNSVLKSANKALPIQASSQFEKLVKSARKNSAIPQNYFDKNLEVTQSKVNQFQARKQTIQMPIQSILPTQILQTPSRILGKESQLLSNVRGDQLEDFMPQNYSDCKTSVQFVILSLMQSFSLKPKQAAGLLTDENKFLTHLLIKGAKGGDFEGVKRWYTTIQENIEFFIICLSKERADIISYQTPLLPQSTKVADSAENRSKIIIKTLNILKGGFYSIEQEIQQLCTQTFFSIISKFNQDYQEFKADAWEWLINQTVKIELKKKNTVKANSDMQLVNRSTKFASEGKNTEITPIFESKDIDIINQQNGLQAILNCLEQNNEFEFYQQNALLLLSFAKIDSNRFFTQVLKQYYTDWFKYIHFCTDLFCLVGDIEVGQQICYDVFDQQGVLKYLVVETFKLAESQNQWQSLNDKVTSIVFLIEVWLQRPNLLEPLSKQSPENMIQILKKGARDYQRTLSLESILQMFRVLDKLAEQRHSFAPIVYKSLVFMLIEFYWEIEVREVMLQNFVKLYQNFDDIPLSILLEPLLKQIENSQYSDRGFNVFDFQFFTYVSSHNKLSLPSAIQLADCMIKIALSSSTFQYLANQILIVLLNRYQESQEIITVIKQNAVQVLQTIANMETSLVIHRFYLRQEENNFFNRLALKSKKETIGKQKQKNGRLSDQEFLQLKTNERLAVNLLQVLIRAQNFLLTDYLTLQILDTFIAVQRQLNVYCLALAYLLKLFVARIDQMIEIRQQNNPNAGSNIIFPFQDELNMILQITSSSPNQGNVVLFNSLNIGSTKKNKLYASVPLGAPMHEPNRFYQVSVALPLNQPEKKKETQGQLYDFTQWEEDWEIRQYTAFQKKHIRLYRELHRAYTNELSVKIPNAFTKATFEEKEKSNDQITYASLLKMIKDFKLENKLQMYQVKEEIIRIVKQINLYILKETVDLQTLTFEGFCHFLLQFAHLIWRNETQSKAYQLIDRLFDHMKEQSQFQKIGLIVGKNETTNRKDVQTLMTLQQIKQQDPFFNLQDYKQVYEKVETIEHEVPDFFPIEESKKIVIELLDSLLAQSLGVHFLEPIQVTKLQVKYLPQLVSRRTVAVQSVQFANKKRGITANQPLSNQVVLSQAQDEANKKYESAKKSKNKNRDVQQSNTIEDVNSLNSDPSTNNVDLQYYAQQRLGKKYPEIIQHKIVSLGYPETTSEDNFSRIIGRSDKKVQQSELFKAQAINRRASKFGQVMHMSVIEANSNQQKQLLFECAEVLDEVLKAVEKGKQKLRLDHTPYKLYNLNKERMKRRKQNEKISEEVNESEPDKEDINYKREAIKNIIFKQEYVIEQQKQEFAEMDEKKKKQEQKLESKKRRIANEYQSVVESAHAKNDPIKRQLESVKAEQERMNQAEQKKKQNELKQKLKESTQQHQQQLKLLSQENVLKQQEEEAKQKITSLKQKARAEKMIQINSQNRQAIQKTKNQESDYFFQVVGSDAFQQLVNKKYQQSLLIKYDQCLKISQRTSGITQAAWLNWMIQQGVGQLVDPKLLVAVHSLQAREQESGQEYNFISSDYPKLATSPPGDKEISFPGFVIAMIKVANLAKTKLRLQANADDTNQQQMKLGGVPKLRVEDYNQYSVDDFTGEDFKAFMKCFKSQ